MTRRLARRPFRCSFAVMLASIALACGASDSTMPDLPPADASVAPPEPLPGWRTWAIDRLLAARRWQGPRSGFVVLIARDGRVVHAGAQGFRDVENELPMTLDSRFMIASMTKPVIATAAMILVEEGRLGLEDEVAKYVPELGDMRVAVLDDAGDVASTVPLERPIQLHDLLSFTAGLGPGMAGDGELIERWRTRGIHTGEGSLAERVPRLVDLPLFAQPGAEWRYGTSMDVVARIVEIAAGEPLDRFLERRIFAPLGMTATSYVRDLPADAPLARLYRRDEDGELAPPLRDFVPRDWTPGGSGLVSTAPDYMRFALMLWNEGSYDGQRILSPSSVRRMSTPYATEGVLAFAGLEGLGFGYGLSVVVDSEKLAVTSRVGDFWWAGAYGTHFWVSPETSIVLVVMQQQEIQPEGGDMPLAPYLVQALALVD